MDFQSPLRAGRLQSGTAIQRTSAAVFAGRTSGFSQRAVCQSGRPGPSAGKGVLQTILGPGRHFLWYGWWETKLVEDTLVQPGEVAVVTSRMGSDLSDGRFLVDGDLDKTTEKGILRKVLSPEIGRAHV